MLTHPRPHAAASCSPAPPVNKTISGLLKLLFPDPEAAIPDEELEAAVRIALESRRRVKEQQKRGLKTEFRNTHFSYFMGVDGVEQFVSTPELHSDEAIDADPLPPGQVWAISPGGPDAAPALYRIESTCGPGSSVKILNAPVTPAFRESVRYGEQNLYSQARGLVGDRDPRNHEFSVQLRAMDSERSGHGLGLPVLLALCGSLIERSTKGRLIVVGALNLWWVSIGELRTSMCCRGPAARRTVSPCRAAGRWRSRPA